MVDRHGAWFTPGTAVPDQDEESSGIIPAPFLGVGWYVTNVQVHYLRQRRSWLTIEPICASSLASAPAARVPRSTIRRMRRSRPVEPVGDLVEDPDSEPIALGGPGINQRLCLGLERLDEALGEPATFGLSSTIVTRPSSAPARLCKRPLAAARSTRRLTFERSQRSTLATSPTAAGLSTAQSSSAC
jgi:hypothetical protein